MRREKEFIRGSDDELEGRVVSCDGGSDGKEDGDACCRVKMLMLVGLILRSGEGRDETSKDSI